LSCTFFQEGVSLRPPRCSADLLRANVGYICIGQSFEVEAWELGRGGSRTNVTCWPTHGTAIQTGFIEGKELHLPAVPNLGLCHLELKEYGPARDHLLQAIAIGLTKRWEGPANFYLGIAYFYSDMLKEAKGEFQKCEKLATQHPIPMTDVLLLAVEHL